MVTGKFDHNQVILVGMLSLVNALINPILYGKMSLRYRQGYIFIFRKILSLCGASKPDGSFFGKILIKRFLKVRSFWKYKIKHILSNFQILDGYDHRKLCRFSLLEQVNKLLVFLQGYPTCQPALLNCSMKEVGVEEERGKAF